MKRRKVPIKAMASVWMSHLVSKICFKDICKTFVFLNELANLLGLELLK